MVSCEDTVANGAAGCPAGQASCQGKLNRFHGNTSDVYTIQCPANCASDPTPVYSATCGNEGATFMDHSSICRSAVANGALAGALPGLVVIRLVEPLQSYPSCPLMPYQSDGDPPICDKYRHLGYSKCADLAGCRNTKPCGCIPSICECGDFDCMYGKRSRPLQLIDSTGLIWPEWNRADESSSQSDFGSPAACCNYSSVAENVTTTPEGGGCCAIQRFRQKWMGHYWMGVRAFEILDDTYQAGCPIYTAEGQCNKQTGCAFNPACGCIAQGGSCASPCGQAKKSVSDASDKEVCVDRCTKARVRANVTMTPILLETGHEPGTAPAVFTLALDSRPESLVVVRIDSNPCDLAQETHTTLHFTPQNWSDPQPVRLSAVVCNPSLPIPETSDVTIKTASADLIFDRLPVAPVTISISRGNFCPVLQIPSKYSVTEVVKVEVVKESNFVFILNYYCREYYSYRDTSPNKAQKYLGKCGDQDCDQKKELGCPYTDINGFCYTASGIYHCNNNKNPLCHVNIPSLHARCPELMPIIPASEAPVTGTSCSNEFGSTCTIRCADGSETTLKCEAQTKTWNASMPSCDSCAAGHFSKQSHSSCMPCTKSACGVGYFRGSCSSQTDASCAPCTGKPANSLYTSTGSPYNVDACSWLCKPEHFQSAGECFPCSTSLCPVGQYRQVCFAAADADAPCISCSKSKPSNSLWTTPGIPFGSDTCQWGCNDGYYLDTSVSACRVAIIPAVLVQQPSPGDLSEADGPDQLVHISLSTMPLSHVMIALFHDSQINISRRIVNISASDWNSLDSIHVKAFDDAMHESPHFGSLSFEVTSDDPAYHALPVSSIVFGISDNDCRAISAPAHGSLMACKNAHGDTCTVVCDPGHSPSTPVQLQCLASTSRWNAAPPTCEGCLSMHFRTGTHCRPCSNSSCVAGQSRRGNCSLEADSSCKPCLDAKPPHSTFSSECNWRCDASYSELNGGCSPLPVPRLVIVQPLPSASESLQDAVQVQIQISRQPASPVTVVVQNLDGQLNVTNGSLLSFTPADWLRERNISIIAYDDSIVEGKHSGLLRLSLSSADPAWDNLVANVSIPISDNDCHAMKKPQHGKIVSCSHEYGDACVFQCDSGFFPFGNITSMCLASAKWSREAPACDTCDEGFYRDGDTCQSCSAGPCSLGSFRSACLANVDSACTPCSAISKPSNSRFITAGEPVYADSCRWACQVGFFQSASLCAPCTISPCIQVGFYRETCSRMGATQDAACEICNSSLPLNASWIASAIGTSCSWMCDRGFETDTSACVPSAIPFIIVQGPSPAALKEAFPTTPAHVFLVLSEPPTEAVTITLMVSNQITLVTPVQLVFTSANWNIPQTVSVLPIDDLVREGDHSGLIFFQSVASPDVLFNGLISPAVIVPIQDNDCVPLIAPLGGAFSSCKSTDGQTCKVQCNTGLDPPNPVVLLCLSTGRWNSSVPTCTKCANGFYLTGLGSCTVCSKASCLIGNYRSRCATTADGACVPCTIKPLNSYFTTSGNDSESCSFSCNANFYEKSRRCVACTKAPCLVGNYRTECSMQADGACVQCTNVRPVHSRFIMHGGASMACDWACDKGFQLTPDSSSCVRLPAAALIITPIRLLTKEDLKSLPATFDVSLSRPPKDSVVATISAQDQLQGCRPAQIVFTPKDYGPVLVSCDAVLDDVPEGPHRGTVVVSLESASDFEYSSLSPELVHVDISEVSCPVLRDKDNHHVLECNKTLGGVCFLKCRVGFEPQLPAVLQCTEKSAGFPVWHGDSPRCTTCSSGHYLNGTECTRCQTSPCPTSHYRTTCTTTQGATCALCTNQLPENARYTSAGHPYDSNSCHWDCVPGSFFNNATFSCLHDMQPSLVVTMQTSGTGEEPGSMPASIQISLSMVPAASVTVDIVSVLAQLNLPSPTKVVITPSNWDTPGVVYVTAIDDAIFEGPHSGPVLLQSSSTDPRFQDLRNWVSVSIADNDCFTLIKPLNGNLSPQSCMGENGKNTKCVVASCNAGYMSQDHQGTLTSTTNLTCYKSSGLWDEAVPVCAVCAPAYFNASGSCQLCSTRECPSGQFRAPCDTHRDAVCQSCTARRPANSHYTTGGIPSDVDNCTWACNLGYEKNSIMMVNATEITCEKLAGIDVRNDPIDSDGGTYQTPLLSLVHPLL